MRNMRGMDLNVEADSAILKLTEHHSERKDGEFHFVES